VGKNQTDSRRSKEVRKRLKIKAREIGYKDWWDRRCTRGKREVKRMHWR